MFLRLITANATLPLRQAILRAGFPVEDSIFIGDDLPTTFHVGAFDEMSDQPSAIATLMVEDDPRCECEPALLGLNYRLRGMAVAETRQRTGLGATVLAFAEREASERGATMIWCNAREPAIPFYRQQGYETVGERYLIPTVGPHFFCRKRLAKSSD